MQNIPVRLGRPTDTNRVSGSIASLAHGQVSFDLGETWDLYTLVQVTLYLQGPMGATNTVTIYGADLAGDATVGSRVLGIPGGSTPGSAVFTNVAPASAPQTVWVRPAGRYVVVDLFNQDGANASGAASCVTFCAYPGA